MKAEKLQSGVDTRKCVNRVCEVDWVEKNVRSWSWVMSKACADAVTNEMMDGCESRMVEKPDD